MPFETPEPQLASTALGDVEYVDFGEGPAALTLHGTPGSWDQGAEMGKFLARGGFRVLAPARPGCGRTALTDELRSPDAQAALMAALLDELGIDRVSVLSWSGGGPSSYRMAAKHGDRVSALAVNSGVSKAGDWSRQPVSDRFMFRTAPGNWLVRVLVAHAPDQVIAGELSSEGDLTDEQVKDRVAKIMADPHKREFALNMALSVKERGDRKAGYENDLEQFAAIDSLGLESIAAPTLIVQGTVDTDVDPEYSRFAVESIPDARLLEIEGGTHLGLFLSDDAESAQAQVLDHFRRHG